jgi:hypothetical protein
MSESSKTDLVKGLRALVDSNNIDDISVTYKVSGGPPGDQIVQKIILSGHNSEAELSIKDEIKSKSEQKRTLKIEPEEKRSIFRQIALGVENLVSAEKAVFLPDSVIATLSIRVADKELTTHFLADERDRIIQNNPIPSEIVTVVKHFEKITGNG